MQYVSLYRKYRPKTFSDVVGQNIVVEVLKNSIINNKISHAYIFSGPRGTGKTSIAKIFAKAVNCLDTKDGDLCLECSNCQLNTDECIDIIEIDAASNNGVDEIREIRNNVKLLPSIFRYKIYIIDEVHMLSTSAFNALLKTLEEPPSHVIFILATTEIHKIPSTVLSRCQKFDFKKISKEDIVNRLKYIINSEKVDMLDDDILDLIADISKGGLRDAINLLDQLLSVGNKEITRTNVYNLIGGISEEETYNLFEYIIKGEAEKIVNISEKYYNDGKKLDVIIDLLINFVKNLLIFNGSDNYFDKNYEKILLNYSKLDIECLYQISEQLIKLRNEIKKSDNQLIVFEIYLLRLSLMMNNNPKNIEIKKDNKEIEKENITVQEEITVESVSMIDKDVDINNCLATADKKLKESFIEKITEVKDYLVDKEFNSVAKLLLKSKPEVVGKEYTLFTFKNNFEVVLFDKYIEEIKKLLKKIVGLDYKIIAVTNEEWDVIKKEYIKNIKNGVKYTYKEPKIEQKRSAKKKNELEKSVENIFGDDYKTEN